MLSRSKRPIFRILFLLCCVMPTLVIGTWSLVRLRPGHARRYEDQLSARLGLHVEIAEVTHPRPGRTRLERLQLKDPETGQLIATANRVEVFCGSGRTHVTVDRAGVERGQLGKIWKQYHDRILKHTDHLSRFSSFLCLELAVRAPTDSVVIRGISGDLEHIASGPKATWCFRLADTPEPIQFTVARKKRAGEILTWFDLDTKSTPLPCSLIRPFSKVFQSLGGQALFKGHILAHHSKSGWEGDLGGYLDRIDLAGLVRSTSTHQLTAKLAAAEIQSLRFDKSQIQSARGQIWAGPGEVSGSFLSAAVGTLGFSTTSQPPPSPQTLLPYHQLRLGFVLSPSGVGLYGRCKDAGEGTVMILKDAQGNRVRQPANQPVPVVNLVRALVPERQLLVPAARETLSLLRMLPLPPAMASNRGLETRSAAH